MEEHRKYLAEQIFVEGNPVTYRTLSRKLKVHVNTAKEMLYDFHRTQNAVHSGSIHATYLVCGTKLPKESVDGEDVDMAGAPFDDEDESAVVSMGIFREAELEDALKSYEKILSIQIYSLGPHPAKDLHTLSDVSRQLVESSEAFDMSPQYGTILRPDIKMRDRKDRTPQPAPKPDLEANAKSMPTWAKQEPKIEEGQLETTVDPKDAAATATTIKKAPSPAFPATRKAGAAVKKAGGSGGIMQSFARAAAKPKVQKATKAEDISQPLSDDGEDDEEHVLATKPATTSDTGAGVDAGADAGIGRKTRQEREADLRRMMDEEEAKGDGKKPEESEEAEPGSESESEPEPEPEPEPELESEPGPELMEVDDVGGEKVNRKDDEDSAEVVSGSGDGRRRGRRRVMKKRRLMDDKGYLVTVEEADWESFSEAETEAEPPKAKQTAPMSSIASGSGGGAKKKAGGGPPTKGQGSIMSFFSKK